MQECGDAHLQVDAEACVSYLFAAADGGAVQRLTDPERDFAPMVNAAGAVARFLLAPP